MSVFGAKMLFCVTFSAAGFAVDEPGNADWLEPAPNMFVGAGFSDSDGFAAAAGAPNRLPN
jgi:hypothetical protein